MKKINLNIELEYDDTMMHGDDQDAIDWFNDEVMTQELELFSHHIGDFIGKVTVIKEPA
jgi:hypothetical protein